MIFSTSSTTVKRVRGFTLVEILVVMAIMAILAAIGISAYGTAQLKARDAKRKSDLQSIARALEMYYSDFGEYPDSDNGQITSGSWGNQFAVGDVVYMQQVPADFRFTYYYQTLDSQKAFRLFARLENIEDSAVPRDGTIVQEYTTNDADSDIDLTGNMGCGSLGCNFVVGSTNAPFPDERADVEAS